MTLETLWYEASPFVYLFSGSMASLDREGSLLLQLSGLLLVLTALTIVGLRFVSRRRQVDVFDERALAKLTANDLFHRLDDRL